MWAQELMIKSVTVLINMDQYWYIGLGKELYESQTTGSICLYLEWYWQT